jgi:hypothetical protein
MLRKLLAVVSCVLLLQGFAPLASAQASTATIAGVILNPSGQPAFGFRVVLRDVASNTQYTSEPTDPKGNYTVDVPLGGRYKVDGVVADDGVTRLPVLEVPPVSVLTAGTTRLNIRFTTGAATTPATTTAKEDEKKKKKGAVPWYKTPGGITGIVIGSAVIVGLAVGGGGGGGDNPVASPSAPGQ